jgi:hypothetical protein
VRTAFPLLHRKLNYYNLVSVVFYTRVEDMYPSGTGVGIHLRRLVLCLLGGRQRRLGGVGGGGGGYVGLLVVKLRS